MAGIRQALPMIDNLRAGVEKPTWDDIAVALSEQGLRTRNSLPLTGKRLTALISEIRKQERVRAHRDAKRRARPDIAPEESPSPSNERPPKPSRELARGKRKEADDDPSTLESEIRAAQYDRHSKLFKGDA